jgi:hypothetical protein
METKFSKKQKKERQVSFRIQEELYEWLEAISKKEKKTKTKCGIIWRRWRPPLETFAVTL